MSKKLTEMLKFFPKDVSKIISKYLGKYKLDVKYIKIFKIKKRKQKYISKHYVMI